MDDIAGPSISLGNRAFKWTEEETRKLIELRAKYEHLFSGKRFSAQAAWKKVLDDLGLRGVITVKQVSKKWVNLTQEYKKIKYPPQGVANDEFHPLPTTWMYFEQLDEILGDDRSANANHVPFVSVPFLSSPQSNHTSPTAPFLPKSSPIDAEASPPSTPEVVFDQRIESPTTSRKRKASFDEEEPTSSILQYLREQDEKDVERERREEERHKELIAVLKRIATAIEGCQK